jgi:hypothetical protein
MPTNVRALSTRLSAPLSTRRGVSRRPFPGVRRRGTVARSSLPIEGLASARAGERVAGRRRDDRGDVLDANAQLTCPTIPSPTRFRRNRLTRTARSAVTCPRAMVVLASTASIPPVVVTPVASTTTGL